MDSEDGRFSPEIFRSHYPLRRKNKSQIKSKKKFENTKSINITPMNNPPEDQEVQNSRFKQVESNFELPPNESVLHVINISSPIKLTLNTPRAASTSPSLIQNDHIIYCFEKRTPLSLSELCLSVINKSDKVTKEPLSDRDFEHCHSSIPDEDSHTTLGSLEDEEIEYYVGDEVTLLKDSHKEPSLNTLMNLNLEGRSNLFDNSIGDLHFTDSPRNLSDITNTTTLLRSNNPDPLISSAAQKEIENMSLSSLENGDFSPDDNDSDYRPSYDAMRPPSFESDTTDIDVRERVTNVQRKRAKRGKPKKEQWVSIRNKNKRMRGEAYEGRRKTEDGKNIFDVPKNERSLKERCSHTEISKYFQCYKITEESRKSSFADYWKLSWQGKKVWVKQTVHCVSVARRQNSDTGGRRDYTYKYTMNTSEGPVPVCKKMYLNTYNIGEWTVHNWTKNEPHKIHKTARNSEIKKREDAGRKYVREFLNKLPKLESHYCRKDTTKLYLEPIWNSKKMLYREYLNYLKEKEKENYSTSVFIFWDEFETMNLSLFSPKKDECDVCCARRIGNLGDEAYAVHILRKDTARQEKSSDKNNKDPTVKVFTFDLQAVLLSPSLNASALYYKTKLKVHNFTIFDLKTSEAFCFIWHEGEGGVNADEFASILYHFILNHIEDNIKHVIFWSDGATNQNRNSILANALLLAAVQKSVIITHKYLEKGHTQMECDSMHATIERKLKNREIYSPAQYVEICKSARLTKPYNVNYLQHTFFRKFSTLPYLSSIRPGNKAGDSTVFDIRNIEYRNDGTIFFKKILTEDYAKLPKKIKMPNVTDSIPLLYDSRLPITKSKFDHLQELKMVLPVDVHTFYDQLPHLCNEQRRNNTCTCRRDINTA